MNARKNIIPRPYVLVGWSFGGLHTREYASQYPDEVTGMVLLDSSHPDQWTGTPEGQAQFESNSKIYSISPAPASHWPRSNIDLQSSNSAK